jgi:hypothetical protein
MADGYLKDAFLMPQNLIGLGVGAAVTVVFGLPVLFLGVAAVEGVYLWQMSSNPRFQRLIRSRRR